MSKNQISDKRAKAKAKRVLAIRAKIAKLQFELDMICEDMQAKLEGQPSRCCEKR